MTNIVEIKVPDIGGVHDVLVAEVYVKVGDTINKDDNLLMLETDKASMEVPSEFAGVVKEMKIKDGDKVNEGDLILLLEVAAKEAVKETETTSTSALSKEPILEDNAKKDTVVVNLSESTTVASVAPSVANKATTPVNAVEVKFDETLWSKAFASPSIRQFARQLGANLGVIKGTGAKGRITREDVMAYVKGILSSSTASGHGTSLGGLDLLPWPEVDFASFGAVEVQELERIKKISGANLLRNWVMIPHVTQFDEVDITELENFRKSLNDEYKKADIKITPLAFLLKACIFALKQFPEFNASLAGDSIVYKKYYNIGFAADTPKGLVVPVIKNADQKGIIELAKESANLAKLARDGKLKPSDMQGGTFTISSLGGIGGTAFTPIINAPEVAILGVSKAGIKPIFDGTNFVPKLMLPLSLSYDHRIIDGALGAKFTSYLVKVLSDIRRLVL
ncbi:MAG: dihydrolipoyllysine-residue acetyltransferase [Bacteroidia bacterium]|nr:MAG: dihydrolipoyllysine-residue acetyltransferase [Bacteroidia bacterium]